MKKIVIIVIGVVFLIFMYQCQKNEELVQGATGKAGIVNTTNRMDAVRIYNSLINDNTAIHTSAFDWGKEIPHYNGNNCGPEELGCLTVPDYEIAVIPVVDPVIIPPEVIGDCEVTAVYDICIGSFGNNKPYYSFYNFALGIPTFGECATLHEYLESLTEEDRNEAINAIAYYVEVEAIKIFVQAQLLVKGIYCDGTWASNIATAEMYKALCSQKCRIGVDTLHEDPREIVEPKDYNLRGGDDPPGYFYYFISCGDGCCVKTTKHCLNADGSLNSSVPVTSVTGSCDPGPTMSDWVLQFCFDVVETCRHRCE